MKKAELALYRGLLDDKRMVQFGQVCPKLFSIGARAVPQLPNPRKSAGNRVPAAAIPAQPVPELDITATQGPASQQALVALITWIKNRAHERQGAAVTNFATTLPAVHGSAAISNPNTPAR